MKRAILGTLILMTCGCQQTVWYRADATPEEERHDLAEAECDAIRCTSGPPPVTYVVVTDNAREAAADAAAAGISDAIVTAIKQAQIVNSEMQAKGYLKVTPQEAARLQTDDGIASNSPPQQP